MNLIKLWRQFTEMPRKLPFSEVASKIWMGKTKGQTTQFPQQIHCKGKERERKGKPIQRDLKTYKPIVIWGHVWSRIGKKKYLKNHIYKKIFDLIWIILRNYWYFGVWCWHCSCIKNSTCFSQMCTEICTDEILKIWDMLLNNVKLNSLWYLVLNSGPAKKKH